MTLKRTTLATRLHLGWAALLLAPALLGARGCDVAVVGSECGGLNGAQCGANQFCDFALDAACGAADQPGTCRETPNACTKQFEPVCGCDDQTYSNACVANAAGVSVASQGECSTAGQACSGLQGLQCASGEFCDFAPDAACGAADQTGVCTVLPEACIEIFAPVCGCDDKTYGNSCEANAAGVSVASEGECASPGNACGGLLGLQCSDGEFCDFARDAACGAADQTGVCTARPEACIGLSIYRLVCGCDDKTYGSGCEANAAGVSVASEGECASAGGSACGGLLGGNCNAGEFCDFAFGDFCGAADATGTCRTIPEICTFQFDPVCGCDDQTYSNACAAHSAGVAVASDGECANAGSACGGLLGLDCNAGEFCDFAIGDFCGAADATGTCRTIPEICTLESNPVCGCDGMTYGNACAANSAGVSVASTAECP